MLEILNSKALTSAIKNSKNEIAILIGSPLSAPDGKSKLGVPNVPGVISLIESFVDDKGLNTDYNEYVEGLNDVEKYQKSFAFVKGWLGQDSVNDIIEQAVLKSVKDNCKAKTTSDLSNDLSSWHLPSATLALGGILSSENLIKGPALTTNFDPLLSISINRSGGQSYQTILHSDGNLNQHRTLNQNNTHVVHLHGYWIDSETMHTPDQLSASRPKLKASLATLLKDKALLVIGYGGWDDVFTEALGELMNDEDAKLDILWAFYESDSPLIRKKYSQLISKVEPAIRKGRFRAYGGIDCHNFLPELEHSIAKKAHLQTGENTFTNQDSFLVVNDTDLANEIKLSSVPKWSYHPEIAHQNVRETEQYQMGEIYKKNRFIHVIADWGMAKLSFLHMFLNKGDNKNIHYVDLEGVYTREDVLLAVKNQLQGELQQIVRQISEIHSVLIFDNIELRKIEDNVPAVSDVVIELTKAITEFSGNVKVILSSRKSIGFLQNNSLELMRFEEYDVKRYIESHSKNAIDPCDKDMLEKITRLSDGIPMIIDRVLSELRFLSIDDVMESNFRPEAYEEFTEEPIPRTLVVLIEKLKNSDSLLLRHAFNLLKVLSVLSYGDTFTNIKRSMRTKPFHPTHLQVLYDLDLLQTQILNTSELEQKRRQEGYDLKLLVVPTLVREYVYSLLSAEEVLEIVKRAADQHFGEEWKSGKLKLCSSDTHLLAENNRNSGSAQVILTHLLRCAVQSRDSTLLKRAYLISLSFSSFLKYKFKYRELSSLASDIKLILKDVPDKLELAKLNLLHGHSLRMLNDNDAAIKLLNMADENSQELNKNERTDLVINLALIYAKVNECENATLYANKAKEMTRKGDSTYQQAETILVKISPENSKKELAGIERDARNNSNVVTANNAALSIAREDETSGGKLSCYERVLNSKGDTYNKIRAVINKYCLLIDDSEKLIIGEKDKMLIYTAYFFAYNQRMSSIFRKANKVIWKLYSDENNIIFLVKLFRLSSLYWRIMGETKSELLYAGKLQVLDKSLFPDDYQLPETRYVELRLRTIV